MRELCTTWGKPKSPAQVEWLKLCIADCRLSFLKKSELYRLQAQRTNDSTLSIIADMIRISWRINEDRIIDAIICHLSCSQQRVLDSEEDSRPDLVIGTGCFVIGD